MLAKNSLENAGLVHNQIKKKKKETIESHSSFHKIAIKLGRSLSVKWFITVIGLSLLCFRVLLLHDN